MKPEREIYEYSIAGVGVAPGEALFLDDKTENVEGARSAGLEAEQYSSWESFLSGSALDRFALPRP